MKAVTVGSATLDIIASVASDDIERMTLHNSTNSFLLLEPGRKVDADSVTTHVGGGAVNAAVSMARLGFDVATLVKLGRDHNAEKIVARLREEGISTDLIRVSDDHATAISVMIASHDKNAAIFTHRGANGYLAEEDCDAAGFAGADLVYITNLSNESANRFPGIVQKAKSAGAFVATNPGIRQLSRKTSPFLENLAHVDLFTCNLEEARALVPALVDKTGWERQEAHRLSDEGPVIEMEGFRLSVSDLCRRLHGLGPGHIALTDGGRGAYLSVNGTLHFQEAMTVEVVGTAGAGDAFASTLAACLVRGDVPGAAMKYAARNAASVIGHVDAQTGLLRAQDLS